MSLRSELPVWGVVPLMIATEDSDTCRLNVAKSPVDGGREFASRTFDVLIVEASEGLPAGPCGIEGSSDVLRDLRR